MTDAFVICHGSSERQTVAIAEAIEERLRTELGRRPSHVEGKRTGEWILMDYIDFVVHVFVEEKRGYYGLDRLWGDAPRMELGPESHESQPSTQRPRRSPSASA